MTRRKGLRGLAECTRCHRTVHERTPVAVKGFRLAMLCRDCADTIGRALDRVDSLDAVVRALTAERYS